MKWLIAIIWVTGLALVVMGGASYFNSGQVVMTETLSPATVSTGEVHLSPSMNPIRVLLNTRYISRTKNSRVNFYDYHVEINSDTQDPIWSDSGSHSLIRKPDEIQANEKNVTKRRTHSLGVVKIPEEEYYHWKTSINDKQSEVVGAEIVIRRNVQTTLSLKIWGGLGLIIVGFILGVLGKK